MAGSGSSPDREQARKCASEALQTLKTAILAAAAKKQGHRKPLTASARGGEGLGYSRNRERPYRLSGAAKLVSTNRRSATKPLAIIVHKVSGLDSRTGHRFRLP